MIKLLLGSAAIGYLIILSILLAVLEAAVTSVIFSYFLGDKIGNYILFISFFVFSAINIIYKLCKMYREHKEFEKECENTDDSFEDY